MKKTKANKVLTKSYFPPRLMTQIVAKIIRRRIEKTKENLLSEHTLDRCDRAHLNVNFSEWQVAT